VEFLATSFALGAGSFVCPSIHEVLGPSLSYATPSKHPSRGASHSGFLCGADLWYCTKTLAHRSRDIGEGSPGGIGNTAPSSSDVIPMGSKRSALQGIEYAFLSLRSYIDVY
jgi:hypothetical protein